MKKHTFSTILTAVLVIILIASTFFIYTASTAKSEPLVLMEPKGDEADVQYKANTANSVTIIAFEEDAFYCYKGKNLKSGHVVHIEKENGIREFVIKNKQKEGKDSVEFILKTAPGATYKCTVNMLDEMTVNEVKKYILLDATKEENEFLNSIIEKKTN